MTRLRFFSLFQHHTRVSQILLRTQCRSIMDKKGILNYADKDGEFKRKPSAFRNWVSKDKDAEFPAEKDRYHLYVSYACPWAHRALIVRQLKGLEEIIPYTSVHWHMLEKGWC